MSSFQQKHMSYAKKQESMEHVLGMGGKHSVETVLGKVQTKL